VNFINLKHENMTWYNTYEEIKAKYPDTVFEEYWLVEEDVAKLMNHEPIIKGWAIIKNDPNIDSDIISSNKSNINVIEAEKNEGDERNILLHIGILSPFNDDPVIIIKQKGV
jgi:hypothetical protein